ncbi:MAG TPA: AMP-binding protein [Kofleriaceae bacterium]|nr:AMP-binding protein [Kofleriaceae bacterium]
MMHSHSISSSPRDSFVRFEDADVEQTIYDRFSRLATRDPDRPAIVQRAGTTTYGALDARARAVAARIAERCPAGAVVALLLEQGERFVAGMLGCLAAATPYVPLDASYPEARLERMLAVARPRLLIASETTRALAHRLADGRCDVMSIDTLAAADPAVRVQRATPSSPAYILFTSGSTGAPKGVVECHRNILHNVLRQTNSFRISRDDRQTLLYTCGVYGGARDIFTTLLNGASLHHYDLLVDGYSGFGAWVARHQISLYCSVTSVFRQLMRHARRRDDFASIRIAKLGGEATRRSDVATFRRWFPATSTLYTGLASTETGTVCQHAITSTTPATDAVLPLGLPVPGMTVRLVSPTGDTVTTGVGEIVVESHYLALGYHGDADATAKKFVLLADGRRAYRTGDLGRYAPDGALIHCGRGDRQIKIRGNRIELAEVEAQVLAHPEVEDAIVVAQPDRHGDDMLVAYVVGSGGDALARSVRAALVRELPAFMVPAAITVLDELPRTVNGKVEIARLPVHSPHEQLAAAAELASRAPSPEELWLRAVDARDRRPGDNFFAAGGDSLEAIHLVEHANRVFGISIPLPEFFRDSSLEHFVALVRAEQARLPAPPVAAVPYAVGIERPVSLTELGFLPERLEDLNANPLHGRIVRALRLVGDLELELVTASLNELVRRHPMLRTTYELRATGWHAIVRAPVPVDFDVIVTSDARLVQRLAAACRERPLDLGALPHLHAQLVQCGPREHVLILDVPHVVADGASAGILERDFVHLYDAFASGLPAAPGPARDYGEHAARERARFANGLTAHERDQLLGSSSAPAPRLPWRAGATLDAPARTQEKVQLSIDELIARLDALARSQQVPGHIGSIAALIALVRRYSPIDDIQIVMPWANRPEGFEDVVGCFMSLLSIRVDTAGASFADLLQRTYAAARASYPIAATPLVVRFALLGAANGGPDLSVNVNFMKSPPLPATTTLAVERIPLEAGSISPPPLTLMRSETGCQLKFRPDLLARSTVERMADELRDLIERFVADPDRPLLTEEHP